MKSKGLKQIELLADKIFLGAFALLFLLITAKQFIGANTNIKIGNDDVGIEQAYDRMVTAAKGLEAQMNMGEVDPRVPKATLDIADRLAETLASLPTPSATVALGTPFVVESVGASAAGDHGVYTLPAPPSLNQPVAKVFGGALDPYVIDAHPELKNALLGEPDQQPFDLFAISVQATFDARAYRRLLETDPDGGGELAPIPRQWWRNRLEILDVRVNRREVFADGSFGPETLLAPLPGVTSLRDRLTGESPVGEFNSLVRTASRSARMIRQPLFYNLIAGESWTPPIDADQSTPIDERASQLRTLRRNIEKTQNDIAQLQKVSAVNADGLIIYASAHQPVSPGGGRGNRGRPKKNDDNKRKQKTKVRLAELANKLDSYQQQEAALIAEMRQDGVNPETGRPLAPDNIALTPIARLQDEDQISVWTHDIHVEPGSVYQYRFQLVFPNPLMGYQQSMAPEMASLAEIATLTTEFSTWSTPIVTPKMEYMFVDRATPAAADNAVGDSRAVASVDLYRFFYGYWRKGQTRVHTGDVIGDQIALAEPMPVWDVTGGVAREADSLGDPIDAMTDLFLLDVVTEPSPGQAGPGGRTPKRQAAVIGSAAGIVTVRRPDEDADSPLRNLLETSVKAGVSALPRTPTQEGPRPSAPGRQADRKAPNSGRPASKSPTPRGRRSGGGLGSPG